MSGEIVRDEWGRPRVVDPATGREEWYTRASTVASTLSDPYPLSDWKLRMQALGLAARPELLTMASETNSKADWRAFNDEAIGAAGGNDKREKGSAFHDAIHLINLGEEPVLPDFIADDIRAYREATEPLGFVQTEEFVAVHSIRVAGSFDAKVRMPDGKVRVADLKTGGIHMLDHEIQLAIYGLGVNYPDADATVPVEQDWGLVISLPGNGRCEIFKADLERGRIHLERAMWLRDVWRQARSMRKERVTLEAEKPITWLEDLIVAAPSVDELRRLWSIHRESWTPEHTGLANARKLALG